jgi:hypothetical protein
MHLRIKRRFVLEAEEEKRDYGASESSVCSLRIDYDVPYRSLDSKSETETGKAGRLFLAPPRNYFFEPTLNVPYRYRYRGSD